MAAVKVAAREALRGANNKAISFYNHSFQLFGETGSANKMQTDYVSPLCDNCLGVYRFQLDETYIQGNDTIFEIQYFPKKTRNFNGLKGTLLVSSNGYALSRIEVQPAETGLTVPAPRHFRRKNGMRITP